MTVRDENCIDTAERLRALIGEPVAGIELKLSFGQMIARRIAIDDPTFVETIDTMVDDDYRANL